MAKSNSSMSAPSRYSSILYQLLTINIPQVPSHGEPSNPVDVSLPTRADGVNTCGAVWDVNDNGGNSNCRGWGGESGTSVKADDASGGVLGVKGTRVRLGKFWSYTVKCEIDEWS
ncbi:unnamed protein product [Phytophthora fragariaefolia]|uniref:Unnamed protein product n=1 Tax=Phytophthora fragariaefolia TaxID=1490495 RepID=A0A9W7CNC6_9STRA|nr:unnamed protein product [Phytophthora fragariaefolia]